MGLITEKNKNTTVTAKTNSEATSFVSTKRNNNKNIKIFNQNIKNKYNETKQKVQTKYNETKQKVQTKYNETKQKVQNEKNRTFTRYKVKLNEDSYIEKYKNNPKAAIDKLKINFSDKQKAELKKYIKDERTLRVFLSYINNKSMTINDMYYGALNQLKEKEADYSTKIKGTLSLIAKGEFKEAWQCAKSYSAHKSNKTGQIHAKYRKERSTSDAKVLADASRQAQKSKDDKKLMDHVIYKKDSNGKHVYNDNAIQKQTEISRKNPKKAKENLAVLAELESINKYDGETMVHTGGKIIENEDVAGTIMTAAHKKDMDSKSLVIITDNLCANKYMQSAIQYELLAKKDDGSDLFSTQNIVKTSNYLIDKNEKTCKSYSVGLQHLSENNSLSGADIVEINQLIHEHPELKDEILSIASNSGASGTDIVNDCKNYVSRFADASSGNNDDETVSSSSNSNNSSPFLNSFELSGTSDTQNTVNQNKNVASNPIVTNNEQLTKTQYDNEATITINGSKYKRSVILNQLTIKFGANAEKILEKMEQNPSFIGLMKKYGDNKILRTAIVEDPQIIDKLKKISCTFTITNLAEIIPVCKTQKSIDSLRMLSDIIDPQMAITYLKDPNRINNILDILQNSALSREMKLKSIKQITGK